MGSIGSIPDLMLTSSNYLTAQYTLYHTSTVILTCILLMSPLELTPFKCVKVIEYKLL